MTTGGGGGSSYPMGSPNWTGTTGAYNPQGAPNWAAYGQMPTNMAVGSQPMMPMGGGQMAQGPMQGQVPPALQGPQFGNYGGPAPGVMPSGGAANTFGAVGNPAGMGPGPSVAQARALMGMPANVGQIGRPGMTYGGPMQAPPNARMTQGIPIGR